MGYKKQDSKVEEDDAHASRSLLKEQIKTLNKENWATLDLTILKKEQLNELEDKLRDRIKEIREAKEACLVNVLCFEGSSDEGSSDQGSEGNALELCFEDKDDSEESSEGKGDTLKRKQRKRRARAVLWFSR